RIAVSPASGQLDHRELRRQHATRTTELRDRRRVQVDHLLAIRRRAPGGGRALRGKEVLCSVGDAEQRTRVSALQRGVRPLRLAPRALAHDGRDRVVARTLALQEIAVLVGELERGDLVSPERVPQLRDGREAVSAQGRYTVGGSVAIGTRCLRSSCALLSIASRACAASTSGSSLTRVVGAVVRSSSSFSVTAAARIARATLGRWRPRACSAGT